MEWYIAVIVIALVVIFLQGRNTKKPLLTATVRVGLEQESQVVLTGHVTEENVAIASLVYGAKLRWLLESEAPETRALFFSLIGDAATAMRKGGDGSLRDRMPRPEDLEESRGVDAAVYFALTGNPAGKEKERLQRTPEFLADGVDDFTVRFYRNPDGFGYVTNDLPKHFSEFNLAWHYIVLLDEFESRLSREMVDALSAGLDAARISWEEEAGSGMAALRRMTAISNRIWKVGSSPGEKEVETVESQEASFSSRSSSRATRDSAVSKANDEIRRSLQERALASLRDQLFIDDEWAWKTPSGFSWIASRCRQDFRTGEIRRSRGLDVFDLTSTVPLVEDVRAPDHEVEILIGELNRNTVGEGFLWDADNRRILSHCGVTLHRESFEWRMKQFASFAIIQLTQAEIMIDDVARMTEGRSVHCSHPESGERAEPDDMLHVIEHVFSPAGQERSKFLSATEFSAAEEWVREATPFATFGSSETGIAVEVPFGQNDTTLVQLDPTVEHPRLGSGLLVSAQLRPPQRQDSEEDAEANARALAISLNYEEWCAEKLPGQRFGGWLTRDTPAGPIVAHAFFVPNAMFQPGLVLDSLQIELSRARWADEVLTSGESGEPVAAWEVTQNRLEHRESSTGSAAADLDTTNRIRSRELFAGLCPFGMRFLRDGERILVVRPGNIDVWNAVSGNKERSTKLPEDLRTTFAWDVEPGEEWVLCGGREGELYQVDLRNDEITPLSLPTDAEKFLRGEDPVLGSSGGVIYPDGTYEDLSVLFEPYAAACSVAISPDGTHAVAAYGQDYALIWDLRSKSLHGLLGSSREGAASRIYQVAWSPDGRLVLTRDGEGGVIVWDGKAMEKISEIPFPAGAANRADTFVDVAAGGEAGAAEFTRDSLHVAVADQEVIRVLRITTRAEVATWTGHRPRHRIYGPYEGRPRIREISFSQDGTRAATVGVDASVRVWDTFSGREIWSVTPAPCCDDCGAIAPDGRSVVWGGCPGGRIYAVPS